MLLLLSRMIRLALWPQVRPRFSMTAGAETVASASGAAQSPGILGGKIQGRTAIITGGSQGVGKVLAKKFAEAGFNVVVAARQADRCGTHTWHPARARRGHCDVSATGLRLGALGYGC